MQQPSPPPPGSSTRRKLLEVEQKFAFGDRCRLEDRLRKEGFAPAKELTMVDWYFDRLVGDGGNGDGDDREGSNDVPKEELPLVRRDHWLRYRESSTVANDVDIFSGDGGQWELKRGSRGNDGGGDGGAVATVYEEIEGVRALEIARSVLLGDQPSPSSRRGGAGEVSTRTFDGHPVPVPPLPGVDVAPFARIVTHRAKWKLRHPKTDNAIINEDEDEDGEALSSNSLFSDLAVDLDTTPDGYAIGEVEAVVVGEDWSAETEGGAAAATKARNDRAVAEARVRIRKFLAKLLEDCGDGDDEDDRRPPMGKLEQILARNSPRIYEVCVESGVIPKPPPPPSTATPTH